ncbi:MAG: dehydrogenase [Blastopirellula sp.]|nr:MAG: dehydrogenase [Blastopirellula sp.]
MRIALLPIQLSSLYKNDINSLALPVLRIPYIVESKMNTLTRAHLLLFAYLILPSLLSNAIFAQEAKPVQESKKEIAGNEATREHIRQFKGRGVVGDFSIKPKTTAESQAAFQVPDDLEIELVLSEPEVRQPICINFDERGRMWVVQYLQYPFPAGLKVVKYDQHLRAVFDKVPLAPPHHDRGRDKITIHEDTNGDGNYDKQKTFIDGLNIVTSALPGKDGVWVMNPPYLLFFADKNHDDIPDGDPEVHLEGFGLEDTHAVANSLTWGPDGWLYGAQGSTCWAFVKRPGIDTEPNHFKGQAIWRYHPTTKQFEVFAEGGGNTFCIEIDSQGRLYSGHNGGNTRGFHFVQGGYFRKNWGKHGELTNPHAYGFIPHIPHANIERFSHTLVRYEGGSLPEKYNNHLFAPVPLHNYVALSKMIPEGSTWKTEDLEHVVATDDQWFRPVDIKVGPDGYVYVIDWYDTRLTHVDPRDTWDRERGRIWRVRSKEAKFPAPFDLGKLSSMELVEQLKHSNKWFRATAQRLLGERKDKSIVPQLKEQFHQSEGQFALELCWAIDNSGGFDDLFALEALEHANPNVRVWAVRLLGDRQQVSPGVVPQLVDMAANDTHAEVRSQLACSAKRLPGEVSVKILEQLVRRDEDAKDRYLPLLYWWAIEDKAVSHSRETLQAFNAAEAWSKPLLADTILPRLAQRYAAEATPENLTSLAQLLETAPNEQAANKLLASIETAFAGQSIPQLPQRLLAAMLSATSGADPLSPNRVGLRLRGGDDQAHQHVLEYIANKKNSKATRLKYIHLLGQVGKESAIPGLLNLVEKSTESDVRRESILALRRFDVPEIAERLTAAYPSISSSTDLRDNLLDVLGSRSTWALTLLVAIENKQIPFSHVSLSLVDTMKLHQQSDINDRVKKIWGNTRSTPAENQDQIRQVLSILSTGKGDASKGKLLYTNSCAKCHKLFGEGKEIGPDLTGYERTNLDFLLLSTIDPSAAIREEFTNFQLLTTDGLVLSGFIRERTPKTITIQNADKGIVVVPVDKIERGPQAISTSLMPDKLLNELNAQQIRDLFAYLQAKTKP